MRASSLIAAGSNTTALVGTPDRVTQSLMRYYDIGFRKLVIRGVDAYAETVQYGEALTPLFRQAAAEREAGVREPVSAYGRE
jgi:alkanesulfonate monooxygenase